VTDAAPVTEAAPVEEVAPVEDVVPAPAVLAEGEPRNEEILEGLIVALDGCAWESTGEDLACPARQTLRLATDTQIRALEFPSLGELERTVARKLLTHTSPQVRWYAVFLLAGDHSDSTLVADAIAGEAIADARFAMAVSVSSRATDDEVLAAIVLSLADDPDPRIRMMIASELPRAARLPGMVEKLTAMASADPDMSIRNTACSSLGELGARSSIAFYETILVPSTESAHYDRCFLGLIRLWTDGGLKKAYKMTLALMKGPYPEKAPGRAIFEGFQWIPDAMTEKDNPWPKRRWAKTSEMKKALLAFVTSKKVDASARASVAPILPSYGVSKKQVEAIRKALPEEMDEDTRHLAEKLDEIIASMK
jgi:hypothetical protein